MKRWIAWMLVSALALGGLSGCKKEKPKEEEPPSSSEPVVLRYVDGEYSVRYDVIASDRTLDYLTISIASDQIEIVDYGMKELELEADLSALVSRPVEEESSSESSAAASEALPVESSQSDAPSASSAPSAPERVGPTESEQLAEASAKKILAEYQDCKGDLELMEPVEGAEEHTYRFIRMMRTALEFAESGDSSSEIVLGRYADGKYESIMPDFNQDGWKEFARATVINGLIDSVEYNAINEEDRNKRIADDPIKMLEYNEISQNFIDNGEELAQMTAKDETFEKLMRPMLVSMLSGGEKQITASRLTDGEYTAIFEDFDEFGWKDFVTLQIRNGKVTVKEFDAIHKDDETRTKSMDTQQSQQMKERTGITFFDAVQELTKRLARSSQHKVTEVDNVAGATISSNNFKLLVGQLLATVAIDGNSEKPLVVERLEDD